MDMKNTVDKENWSYLVVAPFNMTQASELGPLSTYQWLVDLETKLSPRK